jgi:spore maturation protein CgeB
MHIVIPDLAPPDSFQDNVAHTLRQLGHEVTTYAGTPIGGRGFAQIYERARIALDPSYVNPRERWLLRHVRAHRPTMVLAVTQCIKEEVLREVRRLGVRHRVAWWADAPANLRGWGLLSKEWDLVCLKDPEGVLKHQRVGINAKLLHEAMNPEWHRPLSGQANDDIAVAGNYYGYRQYLINELVQRGKTIKLYGSPLPRWSLPSLRELHTGRYIVREEKSKVFGEALACLNSTAFAEGNSLNCRAFEIAGAGGLQIIESKPAIEECFEPDAELLVYNTMEDLLGHVERARHFPEEARRIRLAGARRALAHHTYRHRLVQLLAWAEAA